MTRVRSEDPKEGILIIKSGAPTVKSKSGPKFVAEASDRNSAEVITLNAKIPSFKFSYLELHWRRNTQKVSST
jgi:hypothetical protein